MNSVADRIRTFKPAEGEWRPLDGLFAECFGASLGEQEIDAVFTLFERYPEEDGAGVFWSGIHGLEAAGSYEGRLKSSLLSVPSSSAIALAIRIVNAGDSSFLPLISDVATRGVVPASVRSLAQKFLKKRANQSSQPTSLTRRG